MKRLIDTSSWIEHFKSSDHEITEALKEAQAFTHPWIIGELWLGQIPRKTNTLSDITLLPSLKIIDTREVYSFIETHKLSQSGLNWVDVNLLASALNESASIITKDKKLKEFYKKLAH